MFKTKKRKYKGKVLELKYLPEKYTGDFLKIGNKYPIFDEYGDLFKIKTPEGVIEIFKERFIM